MEEASLRHAEMRNNNLIDFLLVISFSIFSCQEEVKDTLATYDKCGGYLAESKGLLMTPNYPKTKEEINQTYSEDLSCIWTTNASNDKTLFVVKIWDMVIENAPVSKHSNKTICYDYLNISIASIGVKQFCSWSAPDDVVKGLGNSLTIAFHSDETGNYRGAMLTYNSFPNFEPCAHNPCNSGECVVDENQVDFLCNCVNGYTGRHCDIDINECSSSPCKNGGTCTEIKDGGYVCQCPKLWDGPDCEHDIQSDPCKSSPCLNAANCEWITKTYAFVCHCQSGFTGVFCDKQIDECLEKPCKNGGLCIDRTNSYECVCNPGWTGVNCDTVEDSCSSSPCNSKEACIFDEKTSTFGCQCKPGWGGVFCDTVQTTCGKYVCQNGGECINESVSSKRCRCPIGFGGSSCEKDNQMCHNPGIPYVSQDFSWTYGATLMFFCTEGYQLYGSRNLTCQKNQTWSSNMPVCIDKKNNTVLLHSQHMSTALLSLVILSITMAAILTLFVLWVLLYGPWMCSRGLTKVMQLSGDSLSVL